MKKICVVLPTKNEEKTISAVIRGIKEVLSGKGYEDVDFVVTDDSIDQTRNIAKSEGAMVINGGGRGLGYAMYRGLKACLRFNPDIILSFDSDGQCDPAEIPEFIAPIESDRADMVIGSRFQRPDLLAYKYRWINRLGTIVLSRILRAFTGLPLTDSHGGIRAMTAEVVDELEMLGTHTYVQETIIDAVEKGFRVKEIPSMWKTRRHGKSRVVGSIPLYVFYTLPILILRSKQHIKWLYSLGIIFVTLAMAFFLFISYQASFDFKALFSRLPALLLIALLILTGIQLFFFGFIMDLIKDIKYRINRLDRR
jgi:glycosyltransferase involved in cell wall biosynthesis